ncbi:WD40 repeat-like protein [Polyporus arcularius HHB13444]|uniref:WD40 repeat-like protein n=1 Tax=Polyporus arcularius HHB13444 TaxID=1314778 RepID=A0A5C3P2J9_9APHY|nr:WD40 repeat-like protein [Polyporus arcularius HHB13444]
MQRNLHFPIELYEQIIDLLHNDIHSLRHCALTCAQWLPRVRHHLLSHIHVDSRQELSSFLAVCVSHPWLPPMVRCVSISSTQDSPDTSSDLFELIAVLLLPYLPSLCGWKMSFRIRSSGGAPDFVDVSKSCKLAYLQLHHGTHVDVVDLLVSVSASSLEELTLTVHEDYFVGNSVLDLLLPSLRVLKLVGLWNNRILSCLPSIVQAFGTRLPVLCHFWLDVTPGEVDGNLWTSGNHHAELGVLDSKLHDVSAETVIHIHPVQRNRTFFWSTKLSQVFPMLRRRKLLTVIFSSEDRLLPPPGGHEETVTALSYSQDSHWLATAANTIILWDRSTRIHVREWAEQPGLIKGLAFAPHCNLLASVHGLFSGSVMIWSIPACTLNVELSSTSSALRTVSWSRDGQAIASYSGDFVIHIWDVPSRQQRYAIPPREGPPADYANRLLQTSGQDGFTRFVRFSPNGRLIAYANGWGCWMWDLADLRPVLDLHGYPSTCVNVVDFDPTSRYVATGHVDGTVHVWETQAGEWQAASCPASATGGVVSVMFSPTETAQVVISRVSGPAHVWNWKTDQEASQSLLHGHRFLLS